MRKKTRYNMKQAFLVLFFVVFISCGQCKTTPLVQIKDEVTYLTGDDLEGRTAGSGGELKAVTYIAKRFEALRLQSKGDKNTCFQKFEFTLRANPHQVPDSTTHTTEKIIGTNVIGYIDNKKETTVVIGVHYDHLGYGGSGSLYREGKAIHNGADDNASGVAVVIDLESKLREKKPSQRILRFKRKHYW